MYNTQCLAAIYVTTFNFKFIILIDETLGPVFKPVYRSIIPPLVQITM
jgi:hypothetical protein